MKNACRIFSIAFILFITVSIGTSLAGDPPSTFDLRDVNGYNYVTSVKHQDGGTCWTYGTMAAMEGNLLMTGAWAGAGEKGEPNLAEYHLDWWNGFNTHNNDDTNPPTGGGLMVHEGGDYRVASAYLVRGEGAVRDIDGQSYLVPPARYDPSYHYFYPRNIEWFVAGYDLSNIDTIKNKIMSEGVMGTCMCYDASFLQNNVHYQPPSSSVNPNHAIAIIGWDDNKTTQAPLPGAWLCKNSWGIGFGIQGYFWISYYDKHCCKHPEMGAISFQNVEPMAYDIIHYHDYHGWRDTMTVCTEAFNAFIAKEVGEKVEAVNFFTAADDVTYTLKLYDRFEGGQLLDELAAKTGTIAYTGFHTVDLDSPLLLTQGDDFYVYLELSDGGHPYDRTSDVPVLLGGDARVIVESSSNPGESFYREGGVWKDLYDFNDTANFCMKALINQEAVLYFEFPEGLPEGMKPLGPETTMTIDIQPGLEILVPGSGLLHYRFDANDPFSTVPLAPLGGSKYEAVLPHTGPGDKPEFYFTAVGDGGHTAYSPETAPNDVYAFEVCLQENMMEDDFESDLGWTVENIIMADGAWERGDPAGTLAQPEDDHSPDGSLCFVTGKEGGAPDDDDVDGASTYLISPVLDCSSGDAIISFYLWFYHSTWGNQLPLEIYLSNDGSWMMLKIMEITHSPNWNHISFRISDFMPPTDKVRISFRAWDFPNDDTVEALVDDFTVDLLNFSPSLWADAYTISLVKGGGIDFHLDAGSGYAGKPYMLLGTLSGTYPGYGTPGVPKFPIKWDSFTDLIIASINSPIFQNFSGNLDGTGQAFATLAAPGGIDSYMAGHAAHFAYMVGDGKTWEFASNPIAITFDP